MNLYNLRTTSLYELKTTFSELSLHTTSASSFQDLAPTIHPLPQTPIARKRKAVAYMPLEIAETIRQRSSHDKEPVIRKKPVLRNQKKTY